MRLTFLPDPADFLRHAGEYLAADPLGTNVLATVSTRMADQGVRADRDWWLVAHEGGRVVGAAMRTAPAPPRPLYVAPMPTDAAVELARALVERGEEVLGVNGMLPAAQACAGELARLTGLTSRVAVHMRQHRARSVVPPREPAGSLRPARADEAGLVQRWYEEFFVEADAQAGRPYGAHAGEVPGLETTAWLVARGIVHVRELDGVPVHLTAVNPPSFGVVRIGPVFTPAEHRGRGYAGATVAALTQQALAAGHQPMLYTDQANPVSNRLYAGIGYEPVVDAVNLALE